MLRRNHRECSMFDFFRRYNKIVMVFLFLLIIPSFVLFGVERYQGTGKDEQVATIDGTPITSRASISSLIRIEPSRAV